MSRTEHGPDDTEQDYIHTLVRPDPAAIGQFLSHLEDEGIETELAVVEFPISERSGSATLSVELRWDENMDGGDDG